MNEANERHMKVPRIAAKMPLCVLVLCSLAALVCQGAGVLRHDQCHDLDANTLRQLSAAATAYLKAVSGRSIRLEPLCAIDGAPGHLLAEVRSEPLTESDNISSRYGATCLYSHAKKAWTCDGLEANREIALPDRIPVSVTWDVEPQKALGIVNFLVRRSAGLRISACGVPDAEMTFSSADLKAVIRVLRDEGPSDDINAQLATGTRISFGTMRESKSPRMDELCWMPPPLE